MIYTIAEFAIAFLPILLFLGGLMMLDSFKLVPIRTLLLLIVLGAGLAGVAVLVNSGIVNGLGMDARTFSRFLAPFTEEILKILVVVYVLFRKKVGFVVDAAIVGFAVGTGFAIVENMYYMRALQDPGLMTWFVRGFGTAVMHGGTSAIAAIIAKDLSDRKSWSLRVAVLPGLAAAVLIHGLFNQFILPPITTTLVILLTLPPLLYAVFVHSEENTRKWLGTGLDSDMEMLRTIMAGNLEETRVGQYFRSIQESFEPLVVGDILCYLRLYLELSVKAKGILIMKEMGVDVPPDPEVQAQFEEMKYVERTIGVTGKLAIKPLLKLRDADLWQLYMLQKASES